MYLRVDPAVAHLFCRMLSVKGNGRIYIPFPDNCYSDSNKSIFDVLNADYNLKVSTTASEDFKRELLNKYEEGRYLRISQHSNPHWVKPADDFHYAFCVPHFNHEYGSEMPVKPVQVTDSMLHWKCSQGSESRKVNEHILVLEQMMNGVFCGGYFGAVLPARWFGRHHRYMQWWENHAAKVARIRLPGSAVSYDETFHHMAYDGQNCMHQSYVDMTKEIVSSGNWELWIWSRPFDEEAKSSRNVQQLEFSAFRHQLFTYTLESLSGESIGLCTRSFSECDWSVAHIRHFNTLVRENEHHDLFGTKRPAITLPGEGDVEIIEVSDKNRIGVVVKDINEIKKTPRAVQISPTRSKIKLIGHRKSSACVVADVCHSEGFDTDPKTGVHTPAINSGILKMEWGQVSEVVTAGIEEYGGIPCMTPDDVMLMKKRVRKLDVASTPIERMIPVKVLDANGNEKEVWERLYEDSGMWATFPEIMEQWKQRALKMRMNNYLFPFQLNDVIVQAAKGCLFNGNVMGLGKTREMLFTAILRGVKRCLIVVPTKLIGTWQDEVDQTILPFVRRVRRHWNGEIMHIGRANVIEYAKDLAEDNLAFFNIISYDKLKATPRDGRFYKCPECGMTVYSPYDKPQFCPGRSDQYNKDPELDQSCIGSIRRWKIKSMSVDEESGKLKFRKVKIHLSTGKRVHWDKDHPSRDGIPEDDCSVVDFRLKMPEFGSMKPYPPIMERQDSMFKKHLMVESGVDEDGNPMIKPVPRGSHVKWTFSELVRNRFPFVVVDEILYAKNEDSMRSQALNHVNGVNRVGCTGTPMKGNPQSILNYINWNIPRSAFPHYRLYEPGALRRFLNKYETIVRIGGVVDAEGNIVGGKPKQVPKINNPELYQAEIAPVMVRHVRNEPDVLDSIPRIPITRQEHIVEMDSDHRLYYQKWIEKFAEWWEKMKEETENKKAGKGQIIVKLGYLINASTNPHYMLARLLKSKDAEFKQWALEIGKYKGPPTAKMLKTRELVKAAAMQGDKTLVFSTRHQVLDIQNVWAKKVGLGSMVVDGRTSLKIDRSTGRSKRHDLVQKFRYQNYHVMWGGLGALAEGMNIPEANWGIINDYSWEPSDPLQALGRMVRPQQTKKIHNHFLCHLGTIDEYMAALCYLKGRSHSEGIDYMEFDFKTDLIPDPQQYANAIVDGTETVLRRNMWAAVEHIKKEMEEEGEDC